MPAALSPSRTSFGGEDVLAGRLLRDVADVDERAHQAVDGRQRQPGARRELGHGRGAALVGHQLEDGEGALDRLDTAGAGLGGPARLLFHMAELASAIRNFRRNRPCRLGRSVCSGTSTVRLDGRRRRAVRPLPGRPRRAPARPHRLHPRRPVRRRDHRRVSAGQRSMALLDAARRRAADLRRRVYDRVRAKLASEPIEDLRIDFEDGYGNRARRRGGRDGRVAAAALRRSLAAGTAPPYHGIRFKSLEAPTRRRGVRTLDLFVGELAAADRPDRRLRGDPAEGDVGRPGRARWSSPASGSSSAHGLAAGRSRFEIQVETPQSILGADGTALVARMIHAGSRPRAPACTTAPTTTPRPAGSPRRTRAWSTRRPTTPRRSCRWPPPAPASSSPTARPTCCRSATATPSRRLAAARPVGPPLPRAGLSTRAGTCTRPSCRRRYVATYAFYREGLPDRGRAAARLSCTAATPATSTSRRPLPPSPASCCAAVECGAVDEAEVERARSTSTVVRSARWRGGLRRGRPRLESRPVHARVAEFTTEPFRGEGEPPAHVTAALRGR